MPEYCEIIKDFVKGFNGFCPKRLEDDIKRWCYNFFFGFFDAVADYCVKNGRLTLPENSPVCDVLVQE